MKIIEAIETFKKTPTSELKKIINGLDALESIDVIKNAYDWTCIFCLSTLAREQLNNRGELL